MVMVAADHAGRCPCVADRVWTIGDLLDATPAIEPNRPIRVKRSFTVNGPFWILALAPLKGHAVYRLVCTTLNRDQSVIAAAEPSAA